MLRYLVYNSITKQNGRRKQHRIENSANDQEDQLHDWLHDRRSPDRQQVSERIGKRPEAEVRFLRNRSG